MLARAHIRGLGARTITRPVIALDHNAAHTAQAKLDRRRKPDRTGADDHDVSVSIGQTIRLMHGPGAAYYGIGKPMLGIGFGR
jgi:hypothetical protein